jgi:ABC-2 type transport system permease protein
MKAAAGYGALLRLALRRDRIKLPAWLLGSTLLLFQMGSLVAGVADTAEGRQDMSRFMDGGLGAVGAVAGGGFRREPHWDPSLHVRRERAR